MSKSHDDELPGSTLPGAQDKVQVELINGRYVMCESLGRLHIPSFPAPPLDPKKVAEFRNEAGPPSIVDTIIGRRKAYEGQCAYRQLAIESARTSVELSGLHYSEDAIALQERYIRGQITLQECIDEIKRRYRPEIDAKNDIELLGGIEDKSMIRCQRLVDIGVLITEQQLRHALDISREALEIAIRDGRMFCVGGSGGERRFPSFFADESIRGDVETVCRSLGGLSGEVMFQFFMTPQHSLHRKTPIAAISYRHQLDLILRTAVEFKERNLGR
jgi:hypothetical protein